MLRNTEKLVHRWFK